MEKIERILNGSCNTCRIIKDKNILYYSGEFEYLKKVWINKLNLNLKTRKYGSCII